MRLSRQSGIGKEGSLFTYPVFIKSLHGGQIIVSIELSEVQREKILKGMEEVIAVSVLLENDLGTQKDFLSANAVCVIKEINFITVEFCEKLKEQGKIKYFGFSFHDSYEAFETIAKARTWDFCQIQLNYMDTEEQAGLKGYELTERLNLPLVIMEPVKGGSLAGYSDDINARFAKMDSKASIASYALRWVGSLPNVKVILSGMSCMEQLEDNLSTFQNFTPLSQAETAEMEDIVAALKGRIKNGCTGCRYCMPCPAGVDIPGNFRAWNHYHVYGTYQAVQWMWEHEIPETAKAKNCIKCGKCEAACPQKIAIRKDLELAQADLDNH